MKKSTLLFCLFIVACATELEPVGDEPVAGSVGLVTQELDVGVLKCPLEAGHTDLAGWSVPGRLGGNVTCVGRPANEKLLSPSCPTCPLIWVYPVAASSFEYMNDVNAAAAAWNNALEWTVVKVDQFPPAQPRDVPTYGVVVNINDSYTPAGPSSGYYTAGLNARSWYRCYRDGVFINLDLPAGWNNSTYRRGTLTHEIGHSLIQVGPWHSGLPYSVMYESYTPGQYIPGDIKLYLNTLRNQVLNGSKTLPCALRGVGC